MKWFKLNDPGCEFCSQDGKYYGRINGNTFVLTGNRFVKTSLRKNGYMPDEVTEPIVDSLKMLPHHIRYAKEAVRRAGSKLKKLKRNGPFMPPEVGRTIKAQLAMIPHHIRYAKGAIGEMRNLAD